MQKFSYAQQLCVSKSGLALRKTGCLWPGCRIGIALSGGIDSFVLLKIMQIRKAILPFPIEILVLHINPGFERESHAGLSAWLAREGLPGHIELAGFGPRAHTAENLKNSPCFLCARQRRKKLFDLCSFYRLTHLALGHNADDLVSTFFLNLCRGGKVEGMSISATFFDGRLQVIRPLLLVDKKYIRQAGRQWRLPVWENACPSSGTTARTQAGRLVNLIAGEIPNAGRSIPNALVRWQLDKESKS